MTQSALPRLFFVGVGNMGAPMAANLVRAGYHLTVHDVVREKAEPLIKLGAHWVDTLAEGAKDADVVMASLPGPPQVRAVMLGEGGIMHAIRPGTTVIDTSTSAVDLVKELADGATARGCRIDYPRRGGYSPARQCDHASRGTHGTPGTRVFDLPGRPRFATLALL